MKKRTGAEHTGAAAGRYTSAAEPKITEGKCLVCSSNEEALQYIMDNEVITEQLATAEIERYIGDPDQALSYKTGQLKMLEWRARYEKQLGPTFDRRAFHDELLAGGAMPLGRSRAPYGRLGRSAAVAHRRA